MIAVLVVAGLVLMIASVVGVRVVPAAGAPPARVALFGLGVAVLLAAATSAFLARLQETPSQPVAAAQPNQTPRIQRVMVVGDDGAGAIPRTDATFETALAAFEDELRRGGFEVQAGGAVSTNNEALDGVRRTDAEIVQLARRQQPASPDALVLFSVFVRLDFTNAAQTASIRGAATLLRVADVRTLGAFEWTSPSRWTLPYTCDRPCVVQTAGADAPTVASAIAGQILAALKE